MTQNANTRVRSEEITRPVVVVAVDGSEGCVPAIRAAHHEAQLLGARLLAVNVMDDLLPWDDEGNVPPVEIPDPQLREAIDRLHAWLHAQLPPGAPGELVVQAGDITGQLLQVVERESAVLLVLGRRGRGGFESLLLGSVSDHCATHATCPVLVVGTSEPMRDGPIVVGYDGSEGADLALRWAAGWAQRTGAELRLVNAWGLPSFSDTYTETVLVMRHGPDIYARLAGKAVELGLERCEEFAPDVQVKGWAVEGNASAALNHVAEAEGASVLVVGSRGFGQFKSLLLGSVARQVLHHATTPVVVVPST